MIIYKTPEEIEIIRRGGKILAGILAEVAAIVKPGVSTAELESLACDLIDDAGGRPAFKGYSSSPDEDPFPTALCTSINHEVVHAPAIPGRLLEEGDIIGIDIGMEFPITDYPGRSPINKMSEKGGYYTDMAVTVPVGRISQKAKKLLEVTEASLQLAIKKVKPGATINDIGGVIQDLVEKNGFSVVRELVGHGVGVGVHEDPQIPHFRTAKGGNTILKPGMVIAIEPMVNAGGWRVKYAPDGFGIVTADKSLSAHFEHTVAVVEGGCVVMTAR